jgi:hypothetical protein
MQIYRISNHGLPTKGGPPVLMLGEELTTFRKNDFVTKYYTGPRTWVQNLNFPVVLYGCETSSLTLREVHRLKAFGNRVLRRIHGPGRDEVLRSWRKLHNEELHNLYSSQVKVDE